ncbi:hypothetical protein U9M48_000619 [Paspalum notatum var. saurae]|uniref:Uncharacterized protein n=1 Tax=Paspalum notatum var. saurae TaxID=547442 RepID=A0AAQ3SHJ0_PASNO
MASPVLAPVHDTNLSGEISVGLLQNMHNLQKFLIARNELSGHIPPYLFNNTASLQYIIMGNNSLSGPIPYSIGSLTMLVQLSLKYNNMSRLQEIWLASNSLTAAADFLSLY